MRQKFSFYFYIPLIILISSQLFAQNNPSLGELKAGLIQPAADEIQLQTSMQKKKAGIAILYSILLPGMGELYAGDYSLGKYFTIADGVIWGALFGFDIYGSRMENNYKSFAQSAGGANIEGKDDKYFADLGNYIDIEQYNRIKSLERNFIEVYDEKSDYWNWANQSERREYRKMWKSSETAYNNIRFAAGALILNRIASAINAVRLVSKHNKKLQEELGWNVSFGIDKQQLLPTQLVMRFQTSF
jgi:hypothetical protein